MGTDMKHLLAALFDSIRDETLKMFDNSVVTSVIEKKADAEAPELESELTFDRADGE